jgi:hypothetical protein
VSSWHLDIYVLDVGAILHEVKQPEPEAEHLLSSTDILIQGYLLSHALYDN